jgi:hypothetical protein
MANVGRRSLFTLVLIFKFKSRRGMVWMNMCSPPSPLFKVSPAESAVGWTLGSEHYTITPLPPKEHKLKRNKATITEPVAQEAEKHVWDEKLDAWLTAKLQPKFDSALTRSNSMLQGKVTELRLEIEKLLNVNDGMRQRIANLQAENDELRKDNFSLQL